MLLHRNDPHPVSIKNETSISPFFMVCDHAGNKVPSRLANLGLQPQDRYRHIAWDIGIERVGHKLSSLLAAPFVAQTYSRLVIDCNRGIHNKTLIAEHSDETPIIGNQGLEEEHKQARLNEIYHPYHNKIAELIEHRSTCKIPTIFVSLHSFTPKMRDGFARPWHAGILHAKNNQFSMAFKTILERHYPHPIGDNEPYALTEKNDYTVPTHAYHKGLPYLELEIRQDLIATENQQNEWADRLYQTLPIALKEYQATCS